jgi:phosphopantothenoylcysteine decarboxylase/phosphopantothenate--cysteine ligase
MWSNPATQRNIATLRGDGVTCSARPAANRPAAKVGLGRMIEAGRNPRRRDRPLPTEAAGREARADDGRPDLRGIDPVRGITNLSSGKMGFAIARAAHEAGADVTLVCGPVSQPTPRGITRIDVTSALEMHAAVMQHVAGRTSSSASLRSPTIGRQPRRRTEDQEGWLPAPSIELVQNPDILAEVAALPEPPFCVGFAAESQNLAAYAEKKRREKDPADRRQPDPGRLRRRPEQARCSCSTTRARRACRRPRKSNWRAACRPHRKIARKTPCTASTSDILDPRLNDSPPHYATPGSAGLDLRACIEGR